MLDAAAYRGRWDVKVAQQSAHVASYQGVVGSIQVPFYESDASAFKRKWKLNGNKH